ncbi:MAG: alpha/beta family hydrolase [Candidatus Micrarchaeia archaeon]
MGQEKELIVRIPLGSMMLEGILTIPARAKGLVIFAHGSGSSRKSPRNNYVARELRSKGIGTLLFDLLSEEEDYVYENRFNIPLLAERLVSATRWLIAQPEAKNLAIGYFGSSTGSAAALIAASELGSMIRAVVSRGGRPDMAMSVLGRIKAPTLLIVGGNDGVVIELNKHAYYNLKCEKEMEIIPGATHLFEEPGTLEEVAQLAARWFRKNLKTSKRPIPG